MESNKYIKMGKTQHKGEREEREKSIESSFKIHTGGFGARSQHQIKLISIWRSPCVCVSVCVCSVCVCLCACVRACVCVCVRVRGMSGPRAGPGNTIHQGERREMGVRGERGRKREREIQGEMLLSLSSSRGKPRSDC